MGGRLGLGQVIIVIYARLQFSQNWNLCYDMSNELIRTILLLLLVQRRLLSSVSYLVGGKTTTHSVSH